MVRNMISGSVYAVTAACLMSRAAIRAWFVIHKWSSILSTLFLLLLCVTGLPLIFHDEIDAATGVDWEAQLSGPPSARNGVPLDQIMASALAAHPGQVPLFMAFSQDSPLTTVTVGPAPDAAVTDMTLLNFDRTTGAALGAVPEGGVMHVILSLHTDLFLGLPGMLFLGAMGLLFVIALISGVVLYAPFMRRLPFAALRQSRARRTRWLDQHNLLGIVTLAWALIVGLTGVINTLADPLTDQWRTRQVAAMTAAYAEQPQLDPASYGSIDAAMAAATRALPGRSPQFIGFPGGAWSSGQHYAIFFQGDTPLTAHVLTPALVDARTARLTDARDMPLLNQALMLSKPLHFGDYGGLAMKLIWAALTLATIWVLVTGLYLWLRRSPAATTAAVERIVECHAQAVAS
jgi:uncharacterized iron-regulated membrane protein